MDPDIGLTEEEIEEQRRKIGDPRRIYTRSDELYPDARFRPSYVDPSMEKPVYQGMKTGGAEESEISPIDFVSEVPTLAKGAAKGFPALMAMIKKKGPNLPEDMSLLDRIKLAAKRSNVKAPEMEAAQAEREALRNQPKDYFDKVRERANQKIFDENEKKLAEEAAARKAYKAEFDANPTVYHGSENNTIEEFIPSKEGMSGPGVYTTTNPEVASEYATGKLSGVFGKKPSSSNPTVYPLKVRGKLFDRENAQDVWDVLRHQDPSLPHVDFSGEWWKDPSKLKAYDSQIKNLRNYPEAVKKSGMYSGIKVDDNNVVVFEPKNVRSPFAKFDPDMKESGDILAGLAGAGLSFNQIKELLNKKSTDKDDL